MNPPDILGDDIIVTAFTSLCTVSKRRLPHFRLGNQIGGRKFTPADWIANQKFVPELVRGDARFAFDSTDPEQDSCADWHENQ
jgi:hypothetical protein